MFLFKKKKMENSRAGASQNETEPQDNSGDSELPQSYFQGVKALEATEFERAIDKLSLALRDAKAELKPQVLLLRAETFYRFAKKILNTPSSYSERKAVFGLDPMQLAKLCLKDAEVVKSQTPSCTRAILFKARALGVMERYEESLEVFYEGLSLDPLDRALQEGLNEIQSLFQDDNTDHEEGQTTSARKKSKQERTIRRCEDMECVLCMKLLFEPVTTSCGHTFCRPCLTQALDHKNTCPVCRTVLMMKAATHPINRVLENIFIKSFPSEYEARRAEAAECSHSGSGGRLPLFVMEVPLPGMQTILNIFEPRYRLMIRRCLDGNRRFGMASVAGSRELRKVACEVEITDFEVQYDGRYLVKCMGRQRCNILETDDQDGYKVARVEYFTDNPLDGDPEKVANICTQLNEYIEKWLVAIEAHVTSRSMFEDKLGTKPSHVAEPEAFSFWAGNFLGTIHVLSADKQVEILTMTSTLARVEALLEAFQSSRLRM